MADYKTCPYCGQKEIPFKLGVCICGEQVGNIQYVKDSHRFASYHYSFLGIRNNPLAAGFEPISEDVTMCMTRV